MTQPDLRIPLMAFYDHLDHILNSLTTHLDELLNLSEVLHQTTSPPATGERVRACIGALKASHAAFAEVIENADMVTVALRRRVGGRDGDAESAVCNAVSVLEEFMEEIWELWGCVVGWNWEV